MIAQNKSTWGQGLPEPYVAIKDIPLTSVQLMGLEKGHPTLKIQLNNGVSIIRFKASEEEYQMWTQPNMILTGVCRCAKNEWQGKVSAQLILEDYKLDTK